MASHTATDNEDLRAFRDAIHDMPMDMFIEVASTFSMRELLILAEDERYADFAHGELHTRAQVLVHRFKLPVVATFDMMDQEHTVMSGSAALSIVAPGHWSPSDIDFYCPDGKIGAVVSFLAAYEYEVVPWPSRARGGRDNDDGESEGANDDGASEGSSDADSDIPDDDESSSQQQTPNGLTANPYAKHVIKSVVLLKHKTDGYTLNVIESILPCAEAAIFGFHSTVVMNVVTSKGVSSFYPQWTFGNKGVVNRPDGIANWNPRDDEKEKAALTKYKDRGYALATDCEQLHDDNETICDACSTRLKKWSEGTSMTFQRGDSFSPSGRRFSWRLGAQPRELDNLFWKDRGVIIVVQGDGDGRAIVYDGLAKEKKRVDEEGLRYLM